MYPIKKVMAIHDMSCYGRASLTTIIPIISTMGIQVCPLPTTVLSTHTGGYGKPATDDLSNFMWDAHNHWKSLNLEFDCIYTGYLAGVNQAKLVKEIASNFIKENTLLVVDPVMGDDGELYSGFNEELITQMRGVISHANIITPNITEAVFLLGENYEDRFDTEKVDNWAIRLSEFGIENVVITSAPSIKGEKFIDNIIYDAKKKKLTRISVEKINKYYPGTGDAFTSVLIGRILKNKSIEDASIFAGNFISKAITKSNEFEYDSKEGILLEKVLNLLTK